MILRYDMLSQSPQVFKTVTGLTVPEFDEWVEALAPRLEEQNLKRRSRTDRQRRPGGGHPYGLPPRDRILLAIIRMRQHPSHDVLGYLFGVSGATAARTISQVMPLLEEMMPRLQRSSSGGSKGGLGFGLLGSQKPRFYF